MTTSQSSIQYRILIIQLVGQRALKMADNVSLSHFCLTLQFSDCVVHCGAAPNPGCHPAWPEIRTVADIAPESQAGVGSFLQTILTLHYSVRTVSRNLACFNQSILFLVKFISKLRFSNILRKSQIKSFYATLLIIQYTIMM